MARYGYGARMDTKHSSGVTAIDRTFTRRDYMIYSAIITNDAARLGDVWLACEAVSSWAIENPDVDMDESMTWAEWQGLDGTETIEVQG